MSPSPRDPWISARMRAAAKVARAEAAVHAAVWQAMERFLALARHYVLDTPGALSAAAGDDDEPPPAGPPRPDAFPPESEWRGIVEEVVLPIVAALFGEEFAAAARRANISADAFREEYLQRVRDRLVLWHRGVFEELRYELLEAYRQGEGIAEQTARIGNVLRIDATSRRLQAEINHVERELGEGDYKNRDVQLDPVTEAQLRAKRRALYDELDSDKGRWEWMSERIARTECLPGDARVDGALATAVYRRCYEGPMVTVRTKGGREFTGTPNHPVLTSEGWRGLGQLAEGDDLVCYRLDSQDAGAAGDVNVEAPPAPIGEIFDAAGTVGLAERRRTAEPDFHGDGMDGHVDVLGAFGVLRVGSFAAVDEFAVEEILAPADAKVVALACARAPFRRAHTIDQAASLLGVAPVDAGAGDDPPDGPEVDPVRRGELLARGSRLVRGDDGLLWQVRPERPVPPAEVVEVVPGDAEGSRDVRLAEDGLDRLGAPAKLLGDPLAAEAALVELDHVLSVSVSPWSGHVYNLTTVDGYFMSGGLYTGNTMGALNGGSHAGALAWSEDSGEVLYKQWLATDDERTRDTHVLADGQVQALTEPFMVGGFPLDHPGDPVGPAWEVIQCLVDPQTPILTEDGWRPVADVKVGDLVVTHTGRLRAVLRLADRRVYSGEIIRVETASRVLRVTANHPVLTAEGWVVAGELRAGMVVFEAAPVERRHHLERLHLSPVGGLARRAAPALCLPRQIQEDVSLPRLDDQEWSDERHEPDRLLPRDLPPHHRRPVRLGSLLVGVDDAEARCLVQEPDDAHMAVGHQHLRQVLVGPHGAVDAPALPGSLAEGDHAFPIDHGGDIRGGDRIHATMVPATVMTSCVEVVADVTLYNFAVAEDESYIADGIAVHNCRCTSLFLDEDEAGPARDAYAAKLAELESEAPLTAAATPQEEPTMGQPNTQPIGWRGVIAPMGVPTGDGRMLAVKTAAELRLRDMPLVFSSQEALSQGHDGATITGNIENVWIDDKAQICGSGRFDLGSPEGQETARLLGEGFARWVSADPDDVVWGERWFSADGEPIEAPTEEEWIAQEEAMWAGEEGPLDGRRVVMCMEDYRLMGCTFVAQPAFNEAQIEPVFDPADLVPPEGADVVGQAALVASAALVAGAGPVAPPATWFDKPTLGEPTALTVDPDGRVHGHLAVWDSCHTGFSSCVKPPRSATGYAHFHVGAVVTAEGTTLPVGKLTLGGGHANVRLGARAALEHYDDVATAVAVVRAYEDEHGIVVAGAIVPGVSELALAALRRSPLSGDWREIRGQLELIAAHAVNTPGFPVPRTMVASGAADTEGQAALVAAGALPTAATMERLAGRIADRRQHMDPGKLAQLIAREIDAHVTRRERAAAHAKRLGLDPGSRARAAAQRLTAAAGGDA